MVHVVLCPFCGRFHRDVVKVHKVNKAFSTNENIGEDALPDEELPEDSKVRMRAVLKEEMDKKDDV